MSAPGKARIVIIGGGPAGCASALALRRMEFRNIAILHTPSSRVFQIGENVSPEIRPLLHQLGIYPAFLLDGHDEAYSSCAYWGSERRGYNDALLSPYGNGWHLDRARFDRMLIREAQCAGIEMRCPVKFEHAARMGNGFVLKFRDRVGGIAEQRADFVIDATGSASAFATRIGQRRQADASLVCLAMRFSAGQAGKAITQTESVEHGWWYVTSMPGDRVLAAFYTHADAVKSLRLSSVESWIELMHTAPQTGRFLSGLTPVDSQPLGFAVRSFCLDVCSGENWLAAGDAAATYDPLTASGVCKALADGLMAADLISRALNGDTEAMQLYDRTIQARHKQYLDTRHGYYTLEKRWPGSAFWRQMQLAQASRINPRSPHHTVQYSP